MTVLVLVLILVLLWLGGFTLNVAGGAIHLLLVVALLVVILSYLPLGRGRP